MEQCRIAAQCGGCQYQGVPYEEQLHRKQEKCEALLSGFHAVAPIHGMKDPLFYRNKVHHALTVSHGKILSGSYAANSHRVIPNEVCMLEDRISQEIIASVCELLPSFRIPVYDEDRHTGFLRHVLVRRGFATGEVMVVLVTASTVFPSKNAFVKALRERHPEITTVVLNVNNKKTGMVLGERSVPLYGEGFIRDTLCGCTFRISPDSFYQVNPVQTAYLYSTAIEFAKLKKTDTAIDAYCGIGTIGLVAAKKAGHVIGVELNPAAVRDAKINAKENDRANARFYQGDAGKFMSEMAASGKKADVVFMDPPRSGSTKQFINAVARLAPARVVYVSCDPTTLARDLAYFQTKDYEIRRIQPVDMFPFTGHVETVVLMSRA